MAGFDNEVIYGQGLDLSGATQVSNKLNVDGFIYFGNSTGNPQAGLISSSDNVLNVAGGPGSLNLTAGTGLTDNFLQVANNLSDVQSAATSRTNLGLGTIATEDYDNVYITGGTITGVSFGITYTEITGTSANLIVGQGFIPNNVGLVTLTLPATANVGDTIRIIGKGTGLWRVAQNGGQMIVLGEAASTLGMTGYIQATKKRDSVDLVCTDTNVEFTIADSVGNLTFV